MLSPICRVRELSRLHYNALSLIDLIIICLLSIHICMQLCFLCVSVLATFTVMVAWTEAPVLAQASSPSVDTAARHS